MNIKLNELALSALLDSAEGPVGLFTEDRVQRIVGAAQEGAGKIMHKLPGVADGVGYATEPGPRYIIGIRPRGKPEEYLARKADFEGDRGGWLVGAIDAGRF